MVIARNYDLESRFLYLSQCPVFLRESYNGNFVSAF